MTNKLKLIGWQRNGEAIPTPDGIHAEDYFRDGKYLGPDEDGVEPVFADRHEEFMGLGEKSKCTR